MVRSSNSSTRRSSDSPGGAQYGIDVEESMVTDTGEEIHKHGPAALARAVRRAAGVPAEVGEVVAVVGVQASRHQRCGGAVGCR